MDPYTKIEKYLKGPTVHLTPEEIKDILASLDVADRKELSSVIMLLALFLKAATGMIDTMRVK